jgi:3-phenylpropionate/trans-cinnamate dioxygenase ferredoxin reductase subunit
MAGVVIVGASHAGTRTAAALRQMGWAESVTLLTNETALPYHRPPLSKAFLAGVETEQQLLLRGEKFYEDEQIELIRGTEVDRIDPERHVLRASAGEFHYDKLILATGASPRRLTLPGSDLGGVHELRRIDDARKLKEQMERAGSIVIVGGGFIGLEVAATAAKAGKRVTVIESLDRLLARALPPVLSSWLERIHIDHGVRFHFRAQIDHFGGASGQLTHISLSDGETIETELVLIGIGSVANCRLAEAAGIECMAGGIRVDQECRTSAPDVYAIGDCAAQFNRHGNAVMRVESVQNATDQARIAAAEICGQEIPAPGVNWFWTDQYELKIQFAGLVRADGEEVFRGQPGNGSFSLLQLHESQLAWAFSVNQAPDHMAARRLIGSGAAVDARLATDSSLPLAKAALDSNRGTVPALGGMTA